MITEFVPLIIATTFASFMVLFTLLYAVSRKKSPHPKKNQSKTFACGEEIESQEFNIPAESFYASLIKTLRFDVIRRWHSGNLTSYLIALTLGMVLMIVYFMYMWV
ncbi:MAG: hypothetical protein ABIF08_00855 [Nanoarchaeota archaeon]